MRGGRAAAGRGRQARAIREEPPPEGSFRERGPRRSRSGWPTTAGAPGSARTRCPPRRRSTCRSATSGSGSACSRCCRRNPRRVLLPEQRHLLETFAGQIGLALERARLAEATEEARVAAESESLRNTLLASISHDLRTPLAVMAARPARSRAAAARSTSRPARRSPIRSRTRRARCRTSSRTCSTSRASNPARSSCGGTGRRSTTWWAPPCGDSRGARGRTSS